jgi:hypothetical protein
MKAMTAEPHQAQTARLEDIPAPGESAGPCVGPEAERPA